jgi:hypothetical protein
LERLRQHLAEERRATVAVKASQLEEKLCSRKRCEALLDAERHQSQSVLDAEVERVLSGQARVADMNCIQEFRAGAHIREAERQLLVTRALTQEQRAREEEHRARAELLEAEAAARALSHHKARFERGQARIVEAELEEAATEVHAHRAHRERN